MPAPAASATTSDTTPPAIRTTGSTGSWIGCPLIIIGRRASSPSRAGLKARNAPYTTPIVARKNPVKTVACRFSVFQKTAAYPSDSNQSAST